MNAELLLMFTLSCDRAYLFAHPERELTEEESARYDEALGHRTHGVPAQYITGHQEFWGLDLIVGPAVLIPRPETEHVIETVVLFAKGIDHQGHEGPRREILTGGSDPREIPPLAGENASIRDDAFLRGVVAPSGVGEDPGSTGTLRIVDVGTGSGAIALALAKELPEAEIHATDVSPAALEVAEANAARLQMESRIIFHDGDLLAGLPEQVFDFVVSNPPYVGDSEEDQVQLEVRKYEPRGAVFAGPTGVEVIARLVPAAQRALKPGGWLVMEISGTIAERVRAMLSEWDGVEITRDLQGIERVVRARKL
jgi:release factor glutamine methyltransferase